MNHNEITAEAFADAIRKLAANPDNLNNLASYLSHHFPEWLCKYANTPEGLVYELKAFAEMTW